MDKNIQLHKLAEYLDDILLTENGVPVDGMKPEQINAICEAMRSLVDDDHHIISQQIANDNNCVTIKPPKKMKARISTIHDFFTWYLGNTKFVGQENKHWPSVGWQNFFKCADLSVNGSHWEEIGNIETVGPLLYNFLTESRFNALTFVTESLDNVYETHFAIHGVAFSIDSVDEPNL